MLPGIPGGWAFRAPRVSTSIWKVYELSDHHRPSVDYEDLRPPWRLWVRPFDQWLQLGSPKSTLYVRTGNQIVSSPPTYHGRWWITDEEKKNCHVWWILLVVFSMIPRVQGMHPNLGNIYVPFIIHIYLTFVFHMGRFRIFQVNLMALICSTNEHLWSGCYLIGYMYNVSSGNKTVFRPGYHANSQMDTTIYSIMHHDRFQCVAEW